MSHLSTPISANRERISIENTKSPTHKPNTHNAYDFAIEQILSAKNHRSITVKVKDNQKSLSLAIRSIKKLLREVE